MSLDSEVSRVSYPGEATGPVGPFPIPYAVNAEEDITAFILEGSELTPLELNVGYSLNSALNSLTLTAGLYEGATLFIDRDPEVTQPYDFTNAGKLRESRLEAALDRIVMLIQSVYNNASKLLPNSLRVPTAEVLSELPTATTRADKYPAFDSSGDATVKTANQILSESGGAPVGVGLPPGGLDNQVLAKASATDFDVEWRNEEGGGDFGQAAGGGVSDLILDIPTHDDIPSTTHPGVVKFDRPWNGYYYWMAHTPFPNATREFPNICASNDGVNWEVPAGLVNPIYNDEANAPGGFNYTADTELVVIGDYLYCFFIVVDPNINIHLVYQRSLDGIVWEAPYYTDVNNLNTILSPSLVKEENGDLRMWGVKRQTYEFRTWTSTDNGLTWGPSTDCVYPPSAQMQPWHLTVRKVYGTYHLIMQTQSTANARLPDSLFYLTSVDGVNWDGDLGRVLPVNLGEGTDFSGQYRSTMVPVPGAKGLAWDMWVSQRRAAIEFPDSPEKEWKISYHKGMVLDVDRRFVAERTLLTLLQNTWDVPCANSLWEARGAGGSLSSAQTQPIRMESGAAAGSHVIVRPVETDYQALCPPFLEHGQDSVTQWFRHPLRFATSIAPGSDYDATTVAWALALCPTDINYNEIPEPLDFRTFGFKIEGYRLFVVTYNGAYSKYDTGIDLEGFKVYHLALEQSGTQLYFYAGGELVGIYDGAPNTEASQLGSNAPAYQLGNGTQAANLLFMVGKCMISRAPEYPY